MPALSSLSALSTSAPPAPVNPLQVVCAWPVSGQYGPGSRILYYVLVATCVFAQKQEWIRNACLAAALVFPAVAALHGIVLAAIRIDDAVDMDIYGAFQLCSIGILAAPVTVRLSQTYFNDPARNIIFLWTMLVLSGLLSLTVAFFRTQTSDCTHDDAGNPFFSTSRNFTYSTNCGLTCSIDKGPFSPLRRGAANEIFVIPAPEMLTFQTTTLLAGACCIPAILSMISMWQKILQINWKTRFGKRDSDSLDNEPIEGTNGATRESMQRLEGSIRRRLRRWVEIPVFVAPVIAILVTGERNFFSRQVFYQTEPIASIGQWAPIVGTVIAALGSLYVVVLTEGSTNGKDAVTSANNCDHHCHCSMREVADSHYARSFHHIENISDQDSDFSHPPRSPSIERDPSAPRLATPQSPQSKIAKVFTAVGDYLTTAAPDRFDDSEFKHGRALDFPEIPGEEHRNSELSRIRKQYNQPREDDEISISAPRDREQHSRAGSVHSRIRTDANVPISRAVSPQPSQSRRATLPDDERPPFGLQKTNTHPAPNVTRSRSRQRRDTLEVPSPTYHVPMRTNPSTSSFTPIIPVSEGQSSPPAIVISAEPDTIDTDANSPTTEPPSPPQAAAPRGRQFWRD